MKTLLRALFILLIMLGIASQSIRASRNFAENDPIPFLIQRLADMNIRTTRVTDSDILIGQTLLCAQPMLVAPLATSGAADGLINDLPKSDFVIRYAYLDEVKEHPSKIWLTARWVWATVLFNAGLRPNQPPAHLVMVALPRSCPGLMPVDWSALSR